MIRKEMLRLLLNQAQFNGFEFCPWFQTQLEQDWPGTEQALSLLASEGRYYSLLFSHEFARCFWRSGSHMSFMVPAISYSRVNKEGEVVQVTRKPYTRRTIKPDVWKYHLGQMASASDPIEYICRFLPAHHQSALQKTRVPPIAIHA
jgi:hypothetical protein